MRSASCVPGTKREGAYSEKCLLHVNGREKISVWKYGDARLRDRLWTISGVVSLEKREISERVGLVHALAYQNSRLFLVLSVDVEFEGSVFNGPAGSLLVAGSPSSIGLQVVIFRRLARVCVWVFSYRERLFSRLDRCRNEASLIFVIDYQNREKSVHRRLLSMEKNKGSDSSVAEFIRKASSVHARGHRHRTSLHTTLTTVGSMWTYAERDAYISLLTRKMGG